MKRLEPRQSGLRNNYYMKTFLLSLLLAVCIFIPFIIVDGGRFLFYGDFNAQQIPFYRLAHDAVRSGNMGWSHLTDLGANFIGSYSFYLLGSPFFWMTIPFPSEWVQFLMGPLLILKFACAALTGYIYIHRYTKSQSMAMMCSILYAFSGFSVYNIFFNHFHEVIVFFPLLLAALDEYMYKRRRGLFALCVCACSVINYYFFVGQVTFLLIYFAVRMLCGSWKISFRDFLLLALEAILGFVMSAFIMIPSILVVIQNSRTSNIINGWNAVLHHENQRYIHILQSLFFTPDLPARPNFTPDSSAKWASVAAWLPMFGMIGVIGWLQIRRKHWLKKIIWICFIMSFIPFLNSSFQLFNSIFYTRWFYMLTLMMSLATGLALEYKQTDWKRAIKWNLVIVCCISAVIGFMPKFENNTDGEPFTTYGLMQYSDRFWTAVAISLICIALTGFIIQFYLHDRKKFQSYTLVILSVVVVLHSAYFIAMGKVQTADSRTHLIPYALNGGADLTVPDIDPARVDFYESPDNMGMYWLVPTIQAFHSVVPGSIMEFYQFLNIPRDVSSKPDTAHYALRGLLSVKWLFDDDDDISYFAGEDFLEPKMPGWVNYGNENGFDIWENENYIPMGFSYDYYMSVSDSEDIASASDRSLAMLKAVVLSDEQIGRLDNLLEPLGDNVVYAEYAYIQDTRDRLSMSCSEFEYTNTGFNASFSADKERLLFFSVPYEKGWSATVNGSPVDIEVANVGFMAIVVPEGDSYIEFVYRTPGLSIGILISVIALVVFVLYLIVMTKMRPARAPAHYKSDVFVRKDISHYAHGVGAKFGHTISTKQMSLDPVYDKAPPEDTGSMEKDVPKEHEGDTDKPEIGESELSDIKNKENEENSDE